MLKPKIPKNEKERQAVLDSYKIVDSLPEQTFDDLTLIASQICDAPIALISLIDKDRQWFKSKFGLTSNETHRDISFCGHAINTPNQIFEVKDAKTDQRFADNPLVKGELNIGFYAGAPLVDASNHAIGTLCVIDHQPKALTDNQKKALEALSRQVMSKIISRRNELSLESEISIKKRKLEKLEENSFRYQTLIEFAPLGVIISDLNGNIMQSNGVFEKMLGYSKKEFTQMSVADITHPDDAEISKLNGSKLLTGKVKHFTLEKRYITKNKSIKWGRVSSGLVLKPNGKPDYYIAAIEDINDERKLRQDHASTLERLDLAIKGTNDGIIDWYDVNENTQWWSPRFYELIGYGEQEMEASFINFKHHLLHPDDLEPIKAAIKRCIKENIPVNAEFRLKVKSGDYKWFRGRSNITKTFQGKAIRMTGAVSDIDVHKQLELELKATKGFLEKITDIIPNIIYIFNHETMSNEYTNRELGVVLGYSSIEIVEFGDQLLSSIIHPDDLTLVSEHFSGVTELEDGETLELEYRVRHKNGKYRWLSCTDTIFERDKNGKVIKQLGIAVDVTEKKEIEEELRKSVKFQSKITSIAPSIIYVFNQKTMSNEYANRELGEVMGYSATEIQAMGADFLPTLCHPEDFPPMLEYFGKIKALKDNDVLQLEYRLKHKDGNYRWLLSIDTVFERDLDGSVLKHIGIAAEITRQKEIQKKLEYQNSELQQFNYVATHDLKSPIITLKGYFDLLKEELQNPSESISEAIHFMEEEFKNFSITQEGLTNAIKVREKVVQSSSIDLNQIVKEVSKHFTTKVESAGGQLHTELAEQSMISGNTIYLKSILQNLLSNSIKYQSEARPLRVKITSEANGEMLSLKLEDNGLGIDLELQKDKLFKMFNRFHNHSEGSGMGLYMVKSMVDKLGGKIDIDSEVDKGTIFTLNFKLA